MTRRVCRAGPAWALHAVALAVLSLAPIGTRTAGAQVHVAALDTLVEGAQGRSATVRFRIANEGGEAVEVQEAVEAPEGWALLLADPSIRLAPGESVVRLVSAAIPVDAAVVDWPVVYRVARTGGGGAEARVVIRLRPVYAIEVTTREAPRYTVAGSPFVARYALVNRGNVPTTVGLRSTHGGRLTDPMAAPDTTVVIAPGERRTIDARFRTEGGSGLRRSLSIRTYWAMVEVPSEPRWVTASTLVLPRLARGRLDAVLFPGEVGASAGMIQVPVSGAEVAYAPTLQAFAQGQGPLRDGSQAVLGVALRSPFLVAPERVRQFSTADYYQATLRHPRYSLLAGDGGVSLSPLLQTYGFGGAAEVSPGIVRATGLFFADRRDLGTFGSSFVGGGAGVVPLSGLYAGVQGLARDGYEAGEAVSGLVRFSGGRAASGEGELAWGRSGGASGVSYSVRGNGVAPSALGLPFGLSASASAARYDASFPGLSSGQSRWFGSLAADLDRWAASAGLSVVEREPSGGAFALGGSRATRASLRAAYRQRTQLSYTGYWRTDQTLGVERRRTLDLVEARTGVGRRVRASVRGEIGRAADGGGTDDRLVVGGGGSLSARVGRVGSLSANADYVRGRAVSIDPSRPSETVSVGGTAALRLAAQTDAQANVGYQRVRAGADLDFLSARFTVTHVFPWGHRVDVSAETSWSGLAGTRRYRAASAYATYAVPFALRLSAIGSTGLVEGALRDVRGQGLSDVPVFLELSGELLGGAVTDDEGRFVLASIPAGPAYLWADLGGVPGDLLLTDGDRVAVDVHGGVVNRVALVGVAGGSVRVAVQVEPPEVGVRLDPRGEVGRDRLVAGLAVELSGPETVRAYSDRFGRVVFDRLRPGRYVVRLVGEHPGLRPLHEEVAVEVEGGAVEEVVFPVADRRRRVEFAGPEPLRVRATAPSATAPPATAPPATAPPATAPPATPAAPADDRPEAAVPEVHLVQPGESLAAIARRYFGTPDRWVEIFELNADVIATPHHIEAGMRLRVPPGEHE